jgi:glycerophosphoryl diester phosphodiesterase
VRNGRPLLIAHAYGDRRDLLEKALAAGVDAIEVDAWLRGGRLWARHERRLGPLPVLFDWRRYAYHGLGPWALPVGRAYVRLDARPLPLDEVLATIGGRCRLLIDVKGEGDRSYVAGYVAALERLLATTGPGQAMLCGQEWRVLDAALGALPGLPVRYSLERPQQWERLWPRLRSGFRPDGLCLHWALVQEQRTSLLAEMGLPFYVWTVDDPALASRVVALGAEGIITNRLDLLEALSPAGDG